MTFMPQRSPIFGAALFAQSRGVSPWGALEAANKEYARTLRLTVFPETRPDARMRSDARPFIPAQDLPNGVVLWEGPSKLDGAPIMIVLTGLVDASDNEKTDDMIQSWIMRRDVAPHDAVRTGEDVSVCGGCTQRPVLVRAGATAKYAKDKKTGKMKVAYYQRPDGTRVKQGDTCYVLTHNAPLSVYNAYHKGKYPRINAAQAAALTTGRILRIGSYGDPAATPIEVWMSAIRAAKGRTGYTHQWCRHDAQAWKPYLMASTETLADSWRAKAMGWRYFRAGYDPLQPGEAMCPASKEAGAKITCAPCRQCNGEEVAPKRPSRVIRPH